MSENDSEAPKEGILKRIGNWLKEIFDPRCYDKKLEYVFVLIFVVLVVIMVLMYLYTLLGYIDFIPFGDKEFLTNLVVRWFLIPMTVIGIWGVVLFLAFMGIQGILMPIPSELVMLVAGMLWGLAWGGIINIVGGMAAALLCFYIARKGGRPVVEKTVGEKNLKVVDKYLNKYGIWAVIIGRMIPVVPLDLISYGGGVVDIKWKDYLVGTLIGVIPRAFFYGFLGSWMLYGTTPAALLNDLINNPAAYLNQIEALSGPFNLILLLTLLGVGGAFLVYFLWMRKKQEEI